MTAEMRGRAAQCRHRGGNRAARLRFSHAAAKDGLKLEPRKTAIQVVVIDSASKTPAKN